MFEFLIINVAAKEIRHIVHLGDVNNHFSFIELVILLFITEPFPLVLSQTSV